jgi:small subunit ribosomal protein S17
METKTQTIQRKKLKGTVASISGKQSVVVVVSRFEKHPKYGKYMKTDKRYMAHDETDACKVGDIVTIESCRPLSARKRFKVIS